MKKKKLSVALLALLSATPLTAQNSYTVYPIPQEQVAGTEKVSFTNAVTIVAESGIDSYTVDRAKSVLEDHGLTATVSAEPSTTGSNVYLGINGSTGTADKKADDAELQRTVFTKENKYDHHALALFNDGGHAAVVIIGENTDATFYGLATLEQILDNGISGLASVKIYDYADQKSRGLVEGYYGYPYSVDVKKDLMRFMMRYKMNTYLYGAKSDPYHSNYWKNPYPTSITAEQKKNGWLSQDMIKDITATSHQTKVNFIWAIHPGTDFINSSTVVNDIMTKYNNMYKLGVRQFAVFVDDVGVPTSDADLKTNADHLSQLQQALEAKYNKNYTEASDTVRPLHFVPQVYCSNFASADVRKKFFGALSATPSYVTIYTTGNGVWSVPNSSDLLTVKNDLGRNVQWWWNYPCNDNADGQIYTMDMYSNFYDLPSVNSNATLPTQLNNGLGIVSNPMQEGEVSKTALFSVADYAWNNAKFNNQTSWEASYKAVLPGNTAAQEAYRYLALYLRYNDPDALNTLISQFKQNGSSSELISLMKEISAKCDVLIALKDSQVDGEKLLYTDLAPWLLKLKAMAEITEGLLGTAASHESGNTEVWEKYINEIQRVAALSTAEEFKAYALEGMGNSISTSVRPSQPCQRYLLGFIDYLKSNSMDGFFPEKVSMKAPASFSNVEGLKGTVSNTTNITITQTKPFVLNHGEYIGTKLVQPQLVKSITVADTLLANHSVVMSADGKTWTRITQHITYPTSYVRYVGVVNDKETPVTLKLVVSSIKITLPDKTTVRETTIPSGDIYNNMTKDKMTDKDYSTFVCLKRNQQSGDAYTLKLNKQQPIKNVRIGMGTTNQDYMKVGKVQISTDGEKWTNLNVKGTTTSDFTMDLKQVVPISDEVSICDFDGKDQEALYVRLYLSTPNTSKWLRLYEIEVNGTSAYVEPRCTDEYGTQLTQTDDADASTSTEGMGGQQMTYRFQELSLLKSVTLYNDPETTKTAKIEVTQDGSSWTSVGTFSSSIQDVDLSTMSDAIALRVTWTGNTTPAIYEIVENADENHSPVVTEIESVNGGNSSAADKATLTFKDGHLTANSAQGINHIDVYDTAGRLVFSLKSDKVQTVNVPVSHVNGSTLIVRLTLSDGTNQSFKVR